MQKASMWLNLYGRQAVRHKLKKGLKTQKKGAIELWNTLYLSLEKKQTATHLRTYSIVSSAESIG